MLVRIELGPVHEEILEFVGLLLCENRFELYSWWQNRGYTSRLLIMFHLSVLP